MLLEQKITISRYINDVLADTFNHENVSNIVLARGIDVGGVNSLSVEGGTMSGDLDMDANSILNCHNINTTYLNVVGNSTLSVFAYDTLFGIGNIQMSGGTLSLSSGSKIEMNDGNILGVGTLDINTFTPSGTADSAGVVGQIAWDASYMYVKTGVGWKRAALSTW